MLQTCSPLGLVVDRLHRTAAEVVWGYPGRELCGRGQTRQSKLCMMDIGGLIWGAEVCADGRVLYRLEDIGGSFSAWAGMVWGVLAAQWMMLSFQMFLSVGGRSLPHQILASDVH